MVPKPKNTPPLIDLLLPKPAAQDSAAAMRFVPIAQVDSSSARDKMAIAKIGYNYEWSLIDIEKCSEDVSLTEQAQKLMAEEKERQLYISMFGKLPPKK